MVVNRLFFREVVRFHGLPKSIVFYRGPKVICHPLRTLLEIFRTKLKISISSHPQMNGQNKVENIAFSTMPRVIMRDNHNSRDEYLFHIEFQYNSCLLYTSDAADE